VYKLNRRVTVRRYEATQNEIGGLVAVQTGAWSKWAEVQDRTGNVSRSSDQDQWQYDHVVVMRYEPNRQTRSNDVIFYENVPMRINSIQIRNEGAKSWEYIQCSKIDENINNDAPMDTDTIKVFNYVGDGSTNTFSDALLEGKQAFGIFKDGIQYVIITSGSPTGKQALFDSAAGSVEFEYTIESGEVVTIMYY
jgi:head-tail adaptor